MKILLITPPFTQLNTPYPATPQLKGFLKQHGYKVFQADLGIELINAIFSGKGFEELFSFVRKSLARISHNSLRIINNEQHYLQTIDGVMSFLQYRDDTLAPLICSETFLPRASRFDQLPDLEWSFGNMGVNDKARFFATLYIEDIGDLIKDAVTPYFGFSRYAEKLGMSAHSFGPLDQALQQPENIIETRMLDLLRAHAERFSPDVAGINSSNHPPHLACSNEVRHWRADGAGEKQYGRDRVKKCFVHRVPPLLGEIDVRFDRLLDQPSSRPVELPGEVVQLLHRAPRAHVPSQPGLSCPNRF